MPTPEPYDYWRSTVNDQLREMFEPRLGDATVDETGLVYFHVLLTDDDGQPYPATAQAGRLWPEHCNRSSQVECDCAYHQEIAASVGGAAGWAPIDVVVVQDGGR